MNKLTPGQILPIDSKFKIQNSKVAYLTMPNKVDWTMLRIEIYLLDSQHLPIMAITMATGYMNPNGRDMQTWH